MSLTGVRRINCLRRNIFVTMFLPSSCCEIPVNKAKDPIVCLAFSLESGRDSGLKAPIERPWL